MNNWRKIRKKIIGVKFVKNKNDSINFRKFINQNLIN